MLVETLITNTSVRNQLNELEIGAFVYFSLKIKNPMFSHPATFTTFNKSHFGLFCTFSEATYQFTALSCGWSEMRCEQTHPGHDQQTWFCPELQHGHFLPPHIHSSMEDAFAISAI